jgi:hypothetical protein
VGCDIVRRSHADFAGCSEVAAERLPLGRDDGIFHILRLEANELTAFGQGVAALIEQRGAELLLERRDSTADRRWAALQVMCGSGQAPGPRDGKKMLEVVPIYGFSNMKNAFAVIALAGLFAKA